MKKLIIMFALLLGVVSMKAQSNDLYQGITKKLPYRQMVTPYGVQVTFAKTVHIIFPSAVVGEVGLPENIFFLVDF